MSDKKDKSLSEKLEYRVDVDTKEKAERIAKEEGLILSSWLRQQLIKTLKKYK